MQRLKSIVASNAVYKEYDVGAEVRGSGGPGLLWRIHDGTHRAHGTAVSVFVFDKKALREDKTVDKRVREPLIDMLKRGPTQLQKLRHPSLLQIVHPLAESKDYLAFATEPVFASLSNVLGRTDNIPQVVPPLPLPSPSVPCFSLSSTSPPQSRPYPATCRQCNAISLIT